LEGIDGLPDTSGSGSIMDSEATNNVTNLGYQCGCDTGYRLAPDNHNCVGMNVTKYSYSYLVCMG